MNQPVNRTAFLLHIADEPQLLASRNMILSIRWNVFSTDSANAWRIFNSNDFDLVILCHSIPHLRRQWLVSHISDESPSTPILIVSDDGWSPAGSPAIVTPSEPELLISAVGSCLLRSESKAAKPGV